MSTQLDQLYLTWLYSQVGSIRLRNPSRTYWSLLGQLFSKEFVWIIPNDDNRVEDGRELRIEFIHDQEIVEVDPEWLGRGCSMLEMLIALSRRLSFEAEGEPSGWFWHLLRNVGLDEWSDAVYEETVQELIDEVLDQVIHRQYGYDGHGGLFPLRAPAEDQRRIEIWYQMGNYILEHA